MKYLAGVCIILMLAQDSMAQCKYEYSRKGYYTLARGFMTKKELLSNGVKDTTRNIDYSTGRIYFRFLKLGMDELLLIEFAARSLNMNLVCTPKVDSAILYLSNGDSISLVFHWVNVAGAFDQNVQFAYSMTDDVKKALDDANEVERLRLTMRAFKGEMDIKEPTGHIAAKFKECWME